MARRGPDGYAHEPVPLGVLHHARLGVHGSQQQPVVAGETATVYNGEVYNAAELGGAVDQDAALMAEGFHARGAAFMREANGAWAFIQTTPEAVTAVRDRFGLRPLFRYYDGQNLIYASNLATIATALGRIGLQPDINPAYPPKGRVPLPCYYKHTEPLPPGTIETATLLEGRWAIRRTRWYAPHPCDHGPLGSVLEAAVERRLHPHAAVAVSGGVDSYLLRAFAGSTVPAYHLDITDEALAARRIGALVLEPKLVDLADVLATLEQPFYAHPPNYWLAQAIKDAAPKTRVVLTGVGADELFGGYRHHAEPFTQKRYRQVYGIQAPGVEGWRLSELEHVIAHHYGYRTDQMFLRFGLEGRHPYMDHKVVETALCHPHDGKAALKALAKRLGWRSGPKRGFAANLSRYITTGSASTSAPGTTAHDSVPACGPTAHEGTAASYATSLSAWTDSPGCRDSTR
ncbi:hypothetical protein LCGC14_1112800 [marine sediment metagenome]|uniref:asparagine synthase (glutamine-hydrolyzing) n=1 Tax=marine sediment metagenome TaxID=412755 RepID=A0A0F9MU62_9ZZZZ